MPNPAHCNSLFLNVFIEFSILWEPSSTRFFKAEIDENSMFSRRNFKKKLKNIEKLPIFALTLKSWIL